MPSWHSKKEKELIERFGGEHKRQYGVDGEIDGRPVEVRVARKDDRFRLGEDVHRELLREDGYYIMDKIGDGKPPKKVPADTVDDKLPRGDWYEDRGYDHKFVGVDDIF